jgi:hypothetical protein
MRAQKTRETLWIKEGTLFLSRPLIFSTTLFYHTYLHNNWDINEFSPIISVWRKFECQNNLWANTVKYNLLRKGEPSLKKSIKWGLNGYKIFIPKYDQIWYEFPKFLNQLLFLNYFSNFWNEFGNGGQRPTN